MNPIYLLLLCIAILTSCISTDDPPYPLPENALVKLAGDQSKTWKLVSRFNDKHELELPDCLQSYQQTFWTDHVMKDYKNDQNECGQTLTAKWRFKKDSHDNYYIQLTSDQITRYMGIKNRKLLKVRYLTQDSLILEHPDEQSSNVLSTVLDVYVPEASDVVADL